MPLYVKADEWDCAVRRYRAADGGKVLRDGLSIAAELNEMWGQGRCLAQVGLAARGRLWARNPSRASN